MREANIKTQKKKKKRQRIVNKMVTVPEKKIFFLSKRCKFFAIISSKGTQCVTPNVPDIKVMLS